MAAFDRRGALGFLLAAAASPLAAAAEPPVFLHNEGCNCCHAWAERMASAGMPVMLRATGDLAAAHVKLGLAEPYHTCHVGVIEGYAIAGHVPPADILRLLAERPRALGLAVPGMPMGSPGMESGDQTEAYEVLLIGEDGSASTFARYGA